MSIEIYPLTAKLRALRHELEITEDEELSEHLIQRLLEVDGELPETVGEVVKMIKNSAALEEVLRKEANLLSFRASRENYLQEQLKKNLVELLKVSGVSRISSGIFTVSLQKSPLKVVVKAGEMLTLEELDRKFIRVEETLNKKAVLEAHAKKEPIPDSLEIVQSEHPRITVLNSVSYEKD